MDPKTDAAIWKNHLHEQAMEDQLAEADEHLKLKLEDEELRVYKEAGDAEDL